MKLNKLDKKFISTLMIFIFLISISLTNFPPLAIAEVDFSKINCNITEAKIDGDIVTIKCQNETGKNIDTIIKYATAITSVSAAMSSATDVLSTLGAGITATHGVVSQVAIATMSAGATVAPIALPVLGVVVVAGSSYLVYKKLSNSPEKKSE